MRPKGGLSAIALPGTLASQLQRKGMVFSVLLQQGGQENQVTANHWRRALLRWGY